jgi:hypothetical protein
MRFYIEDYLIGLPKTNNLVFVPDIKMSVTAINQWHQWHNYW